MVDGEKELETVCRKKVDTKSIRLTWLSLRSCKAGDLPAGRQEQSQITKNVKHITTLLVFCFILFVIERFPFSWE